MTTRDTVGLTKRGDTGIRCGYHGGLPHRATMRASRSPQETGGWVAVSEACQRALRRPLSDPDPALACREAKTAHMAVGDRVRLITPLGTHEAPLRKEALHLQV